MAQHNLSNPPSFYLNLHTDQPSEVLTFFTALGFDQIKEYSDDKTKSFRLPGANSNICLMVHGTSRFREFIRPKSDVVDAHKATEALFSLAVETKDDVDNYLAKAVQAGGTKDPFVMKDYGAECGMYSRSFTDLDGHIWEVVTMLKDAKATNGA